MIRRNILCFAMMFVFMIGSTYGQDTNGHGTHTAGTIGAVGNNGVGSTGGSGRDVLVGGAGVDRTGTVPTGTVTFQVDGVYLIMTAVRMLMPIL